MKRALPRTNFNSSKLIRFLSELSIVDAPESKQTFSERLGDWLDFSDAITLHAAHSAMSSPAAHAGRQSLARVPVEEKFARARSAMINSIVTSCSPERGAARLKLPTPEAGTGLESAAAYEPFRRFYVAHQGEMELRVRPLRAQVRQALTSASARLAQLAILDAALESILGARERQVLATVPALLEKRFAQLLAAHQEQRAASGDTDNPGPWLARFCGELQGLLLAELDLRLQPTTGLIEAFSHETHQ